MMGNPLITRYSLICLMLLPFWIISGCSEEPASSNPPAAVKKAKSPLSKTPVAMAEKVEEPEPLGFVYSPTGRRDPFEPLIKKDAKLKISDVPLTPLQKYDLGQFRLQAILIGKGEPRAMVGAPDGKTYILNPGIKIGKREGVVTQITRESVLVEEVHYDVTGTVSRKLATIDMPEQKSF